MTRSVRAAFVVAGGERLVVSWFADTRRVAARQQQLPQRIVLQKSVEHLSGDTVHLFGGFVLLLLLGELVLVADERFLALLQLILNVCKTECEL